MGTVSDEILGSFYARLMESGVLDEKTTDAIRALFQSGKKLRADDFIAILSVAKREPSE